MAIRWERPGPTEFAGRECQSQLRDCYWEGADRAKIGWEIGLLFDAYGGGQVTTEESIWHFLHRHSKTNINEPSELSVVMPNGVGPIPADIIAVGGKAENICSASLALGFSAFFPVVVSERMHLFPCC